MRLPPRRPGQRDGRCRNIDSDFFERIVADRCGFSGDGKFGNSERETSEMLLLLEIRTTTGFTSRTSRGSQTTKSCARYADSTAIANNTEAKPVLGTMQDLQGYPGGRLFSRRPHPVGPVALAASLATNAAPQCATRNAIALPTGKHRLEAAGDGLEFPHPGLDR